MVEYIKKPNRFNEERWMSNYSEALQYYKDTGGFPLQKDNLKLHQWASYWWRNVYLKNPELHQNKADMLTDIGFDYKSGSERCDLIWMKNYEEAKAFFDENGHFPTIRENKRIRSWVRTWWNTSADRHPDKVKLLQSIGYSYETVEQHSEKLWSECYEKAKTFFEQQGRFPKKGEGGNLRNWATRWWRKSAGIQPQKAKMLRDIGFSYMSVDEVYEQKWMEHYETACEFFHNNGHFPDRKENPMIDAWARTWWRESYLKYPEKNRQKVEMLTSIGFKFKQI